MKGTVINHVRRGFYLDSVALMRLSRTIAGMDGIEEAALMIGTPANKRLMADAGLLEAAGEEAGNNDLVIGVRAANPEAADAALAEATRWLDRPAVTSGEGGDWQPRSIRAAIKALPDANLALISVPGDFAAAEARKALRHGLHVMIFSDNVTVKDEASLKREARERGLLVMGPDCGTAIINGVPLAFANRVRRGDIGIVGASGTGVQEVSCLIDRGGGGISQAIGVGGRDLMEEVGGISTLMALDALERDPGTRHIVLVSKPPAPSLVPCITERIGASDKTFTVCFIGAGDIELPANALLVPTLEAAARSALGDVSVSTDFDTTATPLPPGRRRVCGLYSGGTLCAEAQVVFRDAGELVWSNAPIPAVPGFVADNAEHRMIDFGDDAYTRGKPHPMIDPSVRDDALLQALADNEVGVIVLDVVIGHGAHDDPAGHLVDILGRHGATRESVIIASVTGTDDDPQDRSAQVAKLTQAGILVAPSNADAAAAALAHIQAA
jgi:FdrA protein